MQKVSIQYLKAGSITLSLALFYAGNACAAEWKPIDDPANLRALFTDTVMQATLTGNVKAEATYNADGTGELRAWGETFPRTWEIRGNDEVCIGTERGTECLKVEQSGDQADTYRGTDVKSGKQVVFTLSRADNKIVVDAKPDAESGAPAPDGGAAKPSMDEIARELANPNTSLASLNFKLQYRQFEGDLEDADDQTSTTLLFQPILPFKREDGSKIIWRPAIPYIFDQPLYQGGDDWDDEGGMGDIAFDLAYAFKPPEDNPGLVVGIGMFASLPTGDEDLGFGEATTLGPEFVYGQIDKEKIWAVFPNHQWDIDGDIDVSLTTINAFYFRFLEGGTSIGTAPIMTFDHEEDEWTIPLNLTYSKTVSIDGRPWKFGGELNYYVEQPDAFGPDWMVVFSFGPVVVNRLAGWFE